MFVIPAIRRPDGTSVSLIFTARLVKLVSGSCGSRELLHDRVHLHVIFGTCGNRYVRSFQQSLHIPDMIGACPLPNDWSTLSLLQRNTLSDT